MRTVVCLLFIAACGGSQQHESPIVEGGSNESTICCCKTIPETDEKEITPKYAKAGRMECSSEKGTCVDDVQCAGQPDPTPPPSSSDSSTPPAADATGQPIP